MVPPEMAAHWKMVRDMGEGLISLKERLRNSTSATNLSKQEKEEMEVLSTLLSDLMKVPYMQEEMERFSERLKSPLSFAHASDPERVERFRKVLLNNPMLLAYIQQDSSAASAIQGEETFFDFMQSAIRRWKTMDSYQLWRAIVDGNLFSVQ